MGNTIFKDIFTKSEYDVVNNLQRWNGYRMIQKENVAEHSYCVAYFCSIIGEEVFDKDVYSKYLLVTHALYHDYLGEMFSFDVNHNVKYNTKNGVNIRQMLDEFEKSSGLEYFDDYKFTKSGKMLLSHITNNHPTYIKDIVKVADWLSMFWFVSREIEMGNKKKKVLEMYLYCIDMTIQAIEKSIGSLQAEARLLGASFNTEFLVSLRKDIFSFERI